MAVEREDGGIHSNSRNYGEDRVRLSYDEGDTWPVAKVIDPGPSSYSDLVVDADDNIGLIYERGNDGGYLLCEFFTGLA